MSEKKIKDSIDNIEPASGAKERMYRNIMKKAAQAAPEEKPAEPKKKPIPFVRYALPIAACLCLMVIGVAKFLPGITPAGPGESTVLGGSPFVEVKMRKHSKRFLSHLTLRRVRRILHMQL